jgi:hypothetical protein
MSHCTPRSVAFIATILWSLVFLAVSLPLSGQTATDASATDLRFHKFQPQVAPEKATPANANLSQTRNGMSVFAAQQLSSLQQDKLARTPAQKKIDSNIIYTMRMLAGQPAASGVPFLNTGIDLDDNNNIVVDMVANVTDNLLMQLTAAGAQTLYTNRQLRSIRAIIPPSQIEGIAASPDVIFISPKQGYMKERVRPPLVPQSRLGFNLPGFEQRADRVRQQLSALLLSTPGTPITWQGSVGTEGDLTHRALDARGVFGINGAGLKIGVLSDGVVNRAQSQATGDLPPDCGTPPCLTVLPGQTGMGDEGTAMLEIIHDMVPGASLYFATTDNGITSFAQNIRDLQTAGCKIIVDDVIYFVETPFQDGQAGSVVSNTNSGVVTQAVNDVVAAGVFYFSSAGNEGNVDDLTSGTFEGDFNPQAAVAPLPAGNVHNFGSGGFDIIDNGGAQVLTLFWADPLGASNNDYDLYVLNAAGATVLAASTNLQTGTQDPIEIFGSNVVQPGNRIVVFQNTGAQNVFFHVEVFRGLLHVATSGETHGHSAASGAYSVAATPAALAFEPPTPDGPFPGPFTTSNQVEAFSSDGPRKIFFHADSSAITPGNFSSSGGTTLNKPDITGADGVSVTGVGGFPTPFYGTSAAAPSAASVAALVFSAKPGITAAQMHTALTGTAIDIMAPGFDRDSGAGIVMALDAVNSLGVAGDANPQLGTITASENPGNGNGVIEAGEGAVLAIQLKNKGGVKAATGVTATLTSLTPGVIINMPPTRAYADIAINANGSSQSPYSFALASNFPCGQTAEFTLTVNFNNGSTRALNFTLPMGVISITSTVGAQPPTFAGIASATGTQVNRITRNAVVSACGTPKPFPGAIATAPTSHRFDSYTFTACQSFCLSPTVNASSGVNIFTAAYSPSFDPNNIGTNYQGDAGLSSDTQTFGITTTASTPYTVVVSEVLGTPPDPTPTTYTLSIPACAINCNLNHLPVAKAKNVTVTAANNNGTVPANVDNGSSDPDGEPVTLTQNPPSPYPIGTTNVILTATDPEGAFNQATATVTVVSPGFSLALSLPNITIPRGQSATEQISFTPNPSVGAAVNFACTGQPAGVLCSFNPGSLPAGSPASSVTLTVAASPTASMKRTPTFYAALLPSFGIGLLGMVMMGGPKRRRRAVLMTTLLLVTAIALLGGCGGDHKKGPFPVSVSATSGNVTQSAVFNLTVK